MKKLLTILAAAALFVMLATGASAKTVLKGDFDMNGKITAMDARSILRIGAKIDECTADQAIIADMNNDGRITAMDARTVLRISAKIEASEETVEIGSEETTTEVAEIDRTELKSGFGLSFSDYIKKFGEMQKAESSGNKIKYVNDYVTLVHDPDVIYTGCISSISISGGNYSLCGVHTGMSKDAAISTLKLANWRIVSQSENQIMLEDNAMRMRLAVVGEKITFIEYYLGIALVTPTTEAPTTEAPTTEAPTTEAPTTEEPTTEEPTTEEPTTEEPTTEEPTTEEPTTEEPTTEEPTTEEPTTEEPTTEKPSEPSEDNSYSKLPAQIKAYLSGEFSFEGYRYDKDQKTPVSMTFANGNVKASMSDSMNDGSTMTLEMLIDNSGKKPVLYFLNSSKMEYVELSSFIMGLMGLDIDSLDVGYAAVDPSKVTYETKDSKLNGEDCVVYKIKTGSDSCDIYMIGEDIKKIVNYDNIGNIKSQMDITSFRLVNKDDATLKNYKKGTLSSVIGISMGDLMGSL